MVRQDKVKAKQMAEGANGSGRHIRGHLGQIVDNTASLRPCPSPHLQIRAHGCRFVDGRFVADVRCVSVFPRHEDHGPLPRRGFITIVLGMASVVPGYLSTPKRRMVTSICLFVPSVTNLPDLNRDASSTH